MNEFVKMTDPNFYQKKKREEKYQYNTSVIYSVKYQS